MNTVDFASATWRKSTRSTNASNCVEIAHIGHTVGVRDSKHPTATLTFFRTGWNHLLRTLAN